MMYMPETANGWTGLGASWRNCHRTGTVVHVAVDGEYAGHIVISDAVKPDAAAAIEALKREGVKKTVMLTGDVKAVGEAVAREIGIDEVHAELLPGDKVDQVERPPEEYQRQGEARLRGRWHQRCAGAFPRGYRHRHGRTRFRCGDRGCGHCTDGRQAVQIGGGGPDFPQKRCALCGRTSYLRWASSCCFWPWAPSAWPTCGRPCSQTSASPCWLS